MASKERMGVKDTVGIVHTKADGTKHSKDAKHPKLTEEMLLEVIKNDR